MIIVIYWHVSRKEETGGGALASWVTDLLFFVFIDYLFSIYFIRKKTKLGRRCTVLIHVVLGNLIKLLALSFLGIFGNNNLRRSLYWTQEWFFGSKESKIFFYLQMTSAVFKTGWILVVLIHLGKISQLWWIKIIYISYKYLTKK